MTTHACAIALGPTQVPCPCLAFDAAARPSIHEFWHTNHGQAIRFSCTHESGGTLHRPISSDEIYPLLRRLVEQHRLRAHKVRTKGGSSGSIVWGALHHPAPPGDPAHPDPS